MSDVVEPANTEAPKRSAIELIKEGSHYLRGTIPEELAKETTHFEEADHQLLKFHGTYQQDDRDVRKERVKAGQEPKYFFMVRLRIPGGALTADQYLAVDRLASEYANQTLRITTRQGFQLHDVLKRNLRDTIRGVNEALLSTLAACGDNVRNVMACPAPSTDRRHTIVQEFARRIAIHLAPRTKTYHEIWVNGKQIPTTPERPRPTSPMSNVDPIEPIYGKVYMPRKFKISIAHEDDNCVDAFAQDIAVIALRDGEDLAGFDVAVGGGFGMNHGDPKTFPRLATPLGFVQPEQLVDVCEKIVTIQRDYGDRANRKHARMKYLVEERGIPWFKAELERRLGYGIGPYRDIAALGIDLHLGWREQGDGRLSLGISVENGRIQDTPELRMKSGLRTLLERCRPDVRLTPMQDILLINLQPSQRPEIESLLREYGIPMPEELTAIQRNSMACPALPTCGLAITEAERALPKLIDQIEAEARRLGLEHERFSIRMAGCPNGCPRPYVAELGFVGRTPGTYNIYVGGKFEGTRLNQVLQERVPYTELMHWVRPLLLSFKEQRLAGESFGDFCHRKGAEALRQFIQAFQSSGNWST